MRLKNHYVFIQYIVVSTKFLNDVFAVFDSYHNKNVTCTLYIRDDENTKHFKAIFVVTRWV